MLKNYIEKTVIECKESIVDGRRLNYSVSLYLDSMDELQYFFGEVDSLFLNDLDKEFVVICTTERMIDVDYGIAKDSFINEMMTAHCDGFAYFGCEGYLKCKAVSHRKSALKWKKECDVICEMREEKSVEQIYKKRNISFYNECLREFDDPQQLYQEMYRRIANDKRILLTQPFFPDLSMELIVNTCSTAQHLYHVELKYSISAYSLGVNLDVFAEKIRDYAILIAEGFTVTATYITLTSCGASAEHDMAQFFSYPQYDYDDEYHREYLTGFCWMNIMSGNIGRKISPMATIRSASNFQMYTLSSGNVVLASKKKLSRFTVEDYLNYYPEICDCLRPGCSEHNLFNFRLNGEDVFFDENEYKIEGPKIVLKRGTSSTKVEQSNSQYNVQVNYGNKKNIDELQKIMKNEFGCNAVYSFGCLPDEKCISEVTKKRICIL